MKKETLQSVIVWRKGVMTDQMTKENVFYVLDPESGLVFEADLLAGEFCSQIDGKKTVRVILEKIADRHELEVEEIEKEASDLIKELKKNKLIELNAFKPRSRSKS